jgi:hypothetical protein
VKFVKPYTYQNGSCVGAHEIWRKKIDGSAPYVEVYVGSPESPQSLGAQGLKSEWKSKSPDLDWGN